MVPCFPERMSEKRTSRAEEDARGLTFEADRAEIERLEPLVSKLGAQAGLQVRHSQ
jgi:hypothetical protein